MKRSVVASCLVVAGALCMCAVIWKTRQEVLARTADRWTGANSDTWIHDFIDGNPSLSLNVPDGRAIARGEHGVYMPKAGPAKGPTSVVLEWPHDLVAVTVRNESVPAETVSSFRARVVEDFKEFSGAFPPKARQ